MLKIYGLYVKGLQSYQLSKLEVSRKVCQPAPPQSARLPGFEPRSRSNHSQSLMAGNFAALWPTDPKFLALKDLNLLKKHIKNQVASSILKVVFAFSKWPHLHRAYVISGCIFFATAVCTLNLSFHRAFQILMLIVFRSLKYLQHVYLALCVY